MFADDVTVIGVAGRDDADTFSSWIADNEVETFDHITDPDIAVWREFGITSQPAFAFLNDDGTVETFIGPMGFESLTERVETLVAT